MQGNVIEEIIEARKQGIEAAIRDLLEFQKLALEGRPELIERINGKIAAISEAYKDFR